MKSWTPLWREPQFQVKMYNAHHSRTTFGSSDVEKVHAVVGRSTFPSQNLKSTTIHHMFGPHWEVEMSKKCTTCLDHFWTLRCFFLCGRRSGLSTLSKVRKTSGLFSSFNYHHPYTTLHYNTLHFPTLHYITLHSTTLHYTTHTTTTTAATTLLYTILSTLRYTTLHFFHPIPLHYATPHCITTTTTTTARTSTTTITTTATTTTLH